MPGNYTLRRTYVDGDILSASDYVADHQQHIDNHTPSAVDDHSASVAQMRTTTSPGDVNSESLPTTLGGELERIRYVLKDIKTKVNGSTVSQWYSSAYSVVPGSGTVTSSKLADGATYIQAVRTLATNVAVSTSETTLVSQGITATRTRIRIHASATLVTLPSDSASHTITFRLKRGATTLVTKTARAHSSGGGEEPEASRTFDYIDNPGAGTYTYTVTAQLGDANIASVVGDYELLLEEIA